MAAGVTVTLSRRQNNCVESLKPLKSKYCDDKDPLDVKRLVCKHYRRGCKIWAPCCNKGAFYACRLCHDEKESHKLNRSEISKLECVHCHAVQDKITKECMKCHKSFGEYACLICRLFDDDVSKQQYHCDKCGICRVGGKDNFFHCDTCGYCMNNNVKDTHKCIPNVSSSGCPICLDDLHSSREGITIPKCGHLIHTNCLKSMAEQGLYRCPTCNASILNVDNHWKHLAQEVKAWPMPRRYKNFFVEVLCNDCHKVNKVKYHIIAMKCKECPSFNTRRTGQESPPGETDSEYSSDSELELSGDESATPFERHISQLLRTLSARVRAIDGDTNDFAGHSPALSQNSEQPGAPLSADYEIPTLYNFSDSEDSSDMELTGDDDDDDSSTGWETESEEVVSSSVGSKIDQPSNTDSTDQPDSGFGEDNSPPRTWDDLISIVPPPLIVSENEGSDDSSQGCSIM